MPSTCMILLMPLPGSKKGIEILVEREEPHGFPLLGRNRSAAKARQPWIPAEAGDDGHMMKR